MNEEKIVKLRHSLEGLIVAYRGLNSALNLVSRSSFEHSISQQILDDVVNAKQDLLILTDGEKISEFIKTLNLSKEMLDFFSDQISMIDEEIKDIKLLAQVLNSSLRFKMNIIDTIMAVSNSNYAKTVLTSTYSKSGQKTEKVENVGRRLKI